MNYADLAEEHKTVVQKLKDVDVQLKQCMEQIRTLNQEKELKTKEVMISRARRVQ